MTGYLDQGVNNAMTNEDAMYRPRYLSLYKIVGIKAFANEGYAAKKQRKTRKKNQKFTQLVL